MPGWPDSDAGRWALLAGGALLLAVIAWLGDWRRVRRNHPDRVGFMPWTGLFLVAVAVMVVAGAIALKLHFFPV